MTLIDQWPEYVDAMRKIGLPLSGTCGEHLIPVRALLIHELPFNDKVVELITAVAPGTLKPDPKNLDPLVAMLPK